MFWEIIVLLLMGLLAWAYRAFVPPAPRLCGTSGGPRLVGPRIKLRDGRHLSYKEHGVPKEAANYKIILVHGFSSNKHEASITQSVLLFFAFMFCNVTIFMYTFRKYVTNGFLHRTWLRN